MKKDFSKTAKRILKIILIVIFSMLSVASFFSMGTVWQYFESITIQNISMVVMFLLAIGFGVLAAINFEDLKH